MIKLDENLLIELGLGSLPKPEKTAFLKHMYETLEMRVGTRLAERMSDQQMVEFEQFIKSNDEQGAFRWLETNFPNYKEVVAEEFEKLKGEIRPLVPQIVSASQAQAAQGQVQPPMQPQQSAPAGPSPADGPFSAPPSPVPPQPAGPVDHLSHSQAFGAGQVSQPMPSQSFQPAPAPAQPVAHQSFGQMSSTPFSASQPSAPSAPGAPVDRSPFGQPASDHVTPMQQSSSPQPSYHPSAGQHQQASFSQSYPDHQSMPGQTQAPQVPPVSGQSASAPPYGPPPSFGQSGPGQQPSFGQPAPPSAPFGPGQDHSSFGQQPPSAPPPVPGQ